MKPIERQILENQLILLITNNSVIHEGSVNQAISNTNKLLELKEVKEEDCCEMPPREGPSFIGKDPGQRKKIVLAIYNDSRHDKDNISHYRNAINGEKLDEVPEGFEVNYG